MSTFYYVDPLGTVSGYGSLMLTALEASKDWDLDPPATAEDKSKWIKIDERAEGGVAEGWYPIHHTPTQSYLWLEYILDNGSESFNFKRYGGNWNAVPAMYEIANDQGLEVWDEHQMSEYMYEQDLAEKMREPGLEEFGSESQDYYIAKEEAKEGRATPGPAFSDVGFLDSSDESGVIAALQGQVKRDEVTEETSKVWKLLKCAHCGIPARFVVEDTPLGSKPFCKELHMAMYLGLPIKTKGHYGYEEQLGGRPPTTTYAITEHPDLDWQKGDLIYEFDTREEAEKCLREQLDSGETMEEDGCEVVALNAESFEAPNSSLPLRKYSFYGSSQYSPAGEMSKDEAVELLKTTQKPIKYTFGWKHRGAETTPITRENAIEKLVNGMTTVTEYSSFVDVNSFSALDMGAEGGLEDIDEMSGKIRKAAESSSAINLEDGDTHKLVIQRGKVPYGIIEVTRSGDEVDIYSRRYHSVDAKHFRAPYQPNQTLGDYFTPDLVYTSTVSDDWMTSALRFGEGSVSAEEYASQGDMGLIARYAYEPSEHFNDPAWNETHGAEHPLGGPMSSVEKRRLYHPYDSYGHHFATIFNKTAPMSVSYPLGEYKEGGEDYGWKGSRRRTNAWVPYAFLEITTEGQNLEIVVIDAEGEIIDRVQLLEDEDDEDFYFTPAKIIEGKRWDLGDIDALTGVEKAMMWRRVEVGEVEPWPFLDVTVDVQGLGVHGVDSFRVTVENPYTGETYIDTAVPIDNIPSGDWWEAESDFSEIEWQLDQQPDLFTDWMAWCESFPTDRKLHQQILIDTYREETGHIGSWDTAVDWWNTLPPRSQESIFNTGKVWNTFLTWRNALQWAAEDVSQITKDQISWLKDNRFPVLINVLDPKYAKKLSIPGSLNIPISKPDKFKKEILKRVPQRDTLIVVYCANQTCDASYRAYNALKRMGYTNVFEYDAGVEGWFWPLTLEAEGDPPWVVAARKVLYGNDWWDVDWSVKDEPPKEDWIEVEWDAEAYTNPYKGARSTTPSMSSLPSLTLPTLYKQDTKGKLRQWTISVEPHSSGNGFILISEAGLVTGSRVPKEGQHITAGAQNRTPFQQAELQARSKWKKKSDKGYYDDLQKAKGQVKTLPMTAHKYWKIKNGKKVMDRGRDITYPAVAQRKYDGVRAHLQVLPNGTVRITSRSGLPTGLLLADIRQDALQLGLPDNIILDGEIYAGQKPGTTEPLHPLKLINGAVSSKTLKPKHLQILGDVQLYVYDAVLLDDPDADFVTRYRTIAKYLAPYTGNKFVLVPNYIVKNETEMDGLFRQFLQEGYEGLMVRNAKGPYQFSRSKNLQKVKPVEDDEFEIIGYAEGTGSHSGMVIWECALPNGKSFTVVPKGTHAERKTWFQEAQQGQHIGKLLTVEYAYLTDDGVPFHPRGKTFYVKV